MEVAEILPVRTFEPGAELCNVVVSRIDPKTASKSLAMLAECLPLANFNLEHLKRIHQVGKGRRGKNENKTGEEKVLEIVICPESYQEFIGDEVKAQFEEPFQVRVVPKFAPTSTAEFEAWGVHWPLIFRPNELDKDRNMGLSAAESDIVRAHMRRVEEEHHHLRTVDPQLHPFVSGGLIVNPVNNRVVSTSTHALAFLNAQFGADSVSHHPLYTTTTVLIEAVAAVVRGELEGVDVAEGGADGTLLSEDPYLCHGLCLYLYEEPDLMASMSLVHSRIARVYFKEMNLEQGALCSRAQLHALPALNHHFRVFRVQTPPVIPVVPVAVVADDVTA